METPTKLSRTAKFLLVIMLCLMILTLIPSALSAAKRFTVQETEFVRISPSAVDLDKDKITYSFTAPLDQSGEWQTNYGDAGTYNITVTASDGKVNTTKNIQLVVEKKNQPPLMVTNKVSLNATDVIDLKKYVYDPDNDSLSFKFNPPFDSDGLWKTNYSDYGEYLALFTASDGEQTIDGRLSLNIHKRNQPPSIIAEFSADKEIEIEEGETLSYYVRTKDNDPEDKMTVVWQYDQKPINTKQEGILNFDYNSAGEHLLTAIVSDDQNTITRNWKILIKNTNRAPQLNLPKITAKEGEKVSLHLPEKDADGDYLTYEFSKPLDENGEWLTDFDSAGDYEIKITASDKQLKNFSKLLLTITNVDREPLFKEGSKSPLVVREGETLVWTIEAEDPDGDDLNVKILNAPEGSQLKGKNFSWKPSYDELKRKGGMLSNILNSLRLEKYLINKKTIPLSVEICGQDKCSSLETSILVYNTNRPPSLLKPGNFNLSETEVISISPSAVDPDGDIVHYSFSAPLGKISGSWRTGYDDQGVYYSNITASDGSSSDTLPAKITVLKNNREPSLKISKDKYVLLEGETVSFPVSAADPDNDNLTIALENLPPGASFKEGIFTWTVPYDLIQNKSDTFTNRLIHSSPILIRNFCDDEADRWLKFTASDDEAETVHVVNLNIKNINQPPQIIDFLPAKSPLTIKTGQSVVFHLAVKDPDQDKLSYDWDFGFMQGGVSGTSSVERTFLSPGEKTITVTVSDGWEKVEKTWTVKVVDEKELPQAEPSLPSSPEKYTYKVFVIEG